MPKTAEVEGYRLTPEQIGFQKKYKILKLKQQLLEGATLQTQERTRTLQGMWGELTGEFDKLQIPQEPTQGFEGMEDGTQEASDKNWKIEY
jgi:hypothetical protein